MEEKKHKGIELRSEEVQEVMGQIPAWIVRRGIVLLFAVVVMLLVGSFFFRYPDVITTAMTLTGQSPAAGIVARSAGKIATLAVADGETVTNGQLLAVIENPASTNDVLQLKETLSRYGARPDSLFDNPAIGRELSLGEVQSAYTAFQTSLHAYRNYRELDYYPKKQAATRAQIQKYHTNYDNLLRQQQVIQAQHAIACRQYTRDSMLFARGVLSPAEHEAAQTTWLQSGYSLEGARSSVENIRIQIGQLEEAVLDLELQQAEKESVLMQEFRTAAEQLTNAINGWELSYCLRSPIDGKVTFTTYWNEQQYVQAGTVAFTVVPLTDERLIGKALLPAARSGKVKAGQRVIVRFLNYPDQEFGVVNGVVSAISLVPAEGNYMVEVSFPDGLTTNYGRTLPLSHEMAASADIVTEELRLIERFFLPLKRVWKEGF